MDIYTTTPKAIEGDILTASAAYTVAPDISDSPVTFALDSNGAIVFRHNADDTVVTEGLLAECAGDEALIAAAKAFAEELGAAGYEGDAEWLASEVATATEEAENVTLKKSVHIDIATDYCNNGDGGASIVYTLADDGSVEDVDVASFGPRWLDEKAGDIAEEYRERALAEAKKVEYTGEEIVDLFSETRDGTVVSVSVIFDKN